MLLLTGTAEVALAGGFEACITVGTVKAWEAMRVIADDTCRPFSKGRRGLLPVEGAGFFVLETPEYAQARGAATLADFAGAGMSADAANIVMPDASGAARAIRAALGQVGLPPQDVDYINPHGTGTAANDISETGAIRALVGIHADELAVLGALQEGALAPTLNDSGPGPDCDLNVVPNTAQQRPVRAALSNSFDCGGLNAVLALRRWG